MVAAGREKQLSAVVDEASKWTPQNVTKRGKPAVVVLSVADYEKLKQTAAHHRPSFVDHLLAMPKDDGVFDRAEIKLRDVEF